MKFTEKTINSITKKLVEKVKEYKKQDLDFLHVTVSNGNRKIGRVLNVSLPPILTCANCSECKYYCYDIKACLAYPSAFNARAKNLAILQSNHEKYFSDIREKLSKRRNNFYFRWHVAGDIPSMEYLENMIQIARDYPHFIFWTYTKNYNLINQYVYAHGSDRKKAIPRNLSIMFSEWRGMPIYNPFDFPVFRCIMPDEKPEKGSMKCPGNCDVCLANKWGCPYGKKVHADLH